ncbi:MAG: D-alanyl-D-alanine carboxypeptidase [Oscillospiraceae bacterium]|nr:D-alanyl-D-alanine carboxypeptidase [Oscillospiraceae bacterium]
MKKRAQKPTSHPQKGAALLTALLLLMSFTVQARAQEPAKEPELSARCAVLMDGISGRVLYAKNSQEEQPIASITKIMTGLVAVERAGLNEKVLIKEEYTRTEGSSIYLKPGETVTMEELLYGLLLDSGNDAALAIAGHLAGNTEKFAHLMNQKATSLGLHHTHFVNPSGLSADNHYSTALDMAYITRAAMENETFSKIFSTKTISIGSRYYKNHNRMLWEYPGAIGGKTGFTKQAGRTLVTCAKKGDHQWLIAVTLNAPNDWPDQTALFNYGFQSYPEAQLCNANEEFCSLPVTGGIAESVALRPKESLLYPLREGEEVKSSVELPEVLPAPIQSGSLAGTLRYTLNGMVIGKTDLVYAESVQRKKPPTLWQRISHPNRKEKDQVFSQ